MGEASSRLGLYSGNQREAILDPREQQLFVLTQGLCELCGAHCSLEIKKHAIGTAAAPAQEGGHSGSGPSCLQVKSKFFSTLAGHLILAASFVRGRLNFAGEGMEAERWVS